MDKGAFSRRNGQGFSMVELLVATAITLIGLLVITQVFAVYEGWKRSTTGVAQSQEGGLLGAFSIEQDLRNAGFGMIGLECAQVKAYNAKAVPQTFALAGLPITIDKGTSEQGSDRISVLYGSSAFGNVAATIQSDMYDSAAVLHVDHGVGFNDNYPKILDLLVITQPPKDCSLVQVTGAAISEGANLTSPGSSWKLPHDSGDSAPWNPPGGKSIFPDGGYTVGAKVFNLGQLVDHRFYVQDGSLRMDERDPVYGSVTSYDLASGAVGLRARYGRDNNGDGVLDVFDNETEKLKAAGVKALLAVQFGLIVRSGNREKTQVSPASIAFWPGESLDLGDEERHYRYRVFQTVVPLKNIIWNK